MARSLGIGVLQGVDQGWDAQPQPQEQGSGAQQHNDHCAGQTAQGGPLSLALKGDYRHGYCCWHKK